MNFKIDDVFLEVVSEKFNSKRTDNVVVSNVSINSIENSLDQALDRKINKIFLKRPIPLDVVASYKEFRVESSTVLYKVDFVNKKIISIKYLGRNNE